MAEPIQTKHCSKCKQIKSFSEFYKRIDRKSGFQSHCKTCKLSYAKTKQGKATKKRYTQSNKGKITNKRYAQSKKNKIVHKRYEQSDKGKIAIATRSAVRYAIYIGQLPQPSTLQCHYCPVQAEEYHHHKGYEFKHRLNVVPACIECHHLHNHSNSVIKQDSKSV